MRTLRVLSRLLTYPSADLLEQTTALKEVLVEDAFLKTKPLKNITQFLDEFGQTELLQAQENYVEIFDRGRAHCLHLFEHVHGESRFRGQAMIELTERYAEKGLVIGVGELPDYLPVFLEFISICEPEEGLATLTQAAPVIATIGEKLRRKKSSYAHVFAAIVDLSDAKLTRKEIEKAADAALPNIKTLDELDKQWEEPEAFGGESACNSCDAMPLQHASQPADKRSGAPKRSSQSVTPGEGS